VGVEVEWVEEREGRNGLSHRTSNLYIYVKVEIEAKQWHGRSTNPITAKFQGNEGTRHQVPEKGALERELKFRVLCPLGELGLCLSPLILWVLPWCGWLPPICPFKIHTQVHTW
jgi:hypothetical protein